MIHQLLNLARPLIVLDTETTGTDPQKDRVVEIGFQVWTAEGMMKEWRSLVNPGVPIPASATRVHGITDDVMTLCTKCQQKKDAHRTWPGNVAVNPLECVEFHPVPTFTQLAPNLAKGFTDCDFAGQNVRFDLRIVAAEMARAKVEWNYLGARIVDSSQLERLAVPRSLSHLHEKYVGLKHDGAHGALSDVRAAATVICLQLRAHEQLPRDLDALHNLQWPGWIDGEGKFRFVDGVPRFGGWGKHANKAMRDVEAGYWDFILKSDFPADVKRLAADAKLGKFPKEKK